MEWEPSAGVARDVKRYCFVGGRGRSAQRACRGWRINQCVVQAASAMQVAFSSCIGVL